MSDITGNPLPTSQVLWLTVYWWSLVANLYLLGSAVLLHDDTEPYQVVILVLAGAAVVIGSTFATRIARRGVSNVVFVKSTTTIRVVAVGWFMLGVILILVPVIEVLAGVKVGSDGLTDGLLGTVGSISFLGMIGPGYAEYREGMASAHPRSPSLERIERRDASEQRRPGEGDDDDRREVAGHVERRRPRDGRLEE
jgi:hypothetical protein